MFSDLEFEHNNTKKVLFNKNDEKIEAFFDKNNHLVINFCKNAGLDNTFLGDINHNHNYKISKDKLKLLNLLNNNEVLIDEGDTYLILLENIIQDKDIRDNFKEFLNKNEISYDIDYKRV